MLIDPGADTCFFSDQIAYQVDVNPVSGGKFGSVQSLHGKRKTAIYPIVAEFPQLGIEISIPEAEFTQLEKGWNGLLGHKGFLNLFHRISFFPGKMVEFELPSPPSLEGLVRQIVYR